jgi:Protein of unknown function (DUF2846)
MATGRRLPMLVWAAAAGLLALFTTGCAAPPPPAAPVPPGQARLWFYRVWDPSESLNLANIDVNGVYFGSVAPGGAFYRDVAPGTYHIAPQNQYFDYGQDTNVALIPGQQVYLKILDLASWANAVSGRPWYIHRDAFYARLVAPPAAEAEIANPFLVPRPVLRQALLPQ